MQLREYRPADCQRLEMLFLAADERGVGLGRQMLECAVRHYGVRELTVNAQTVGFMSTRTFPPESGRNG